MTVICHNYIEVIQLCFFVFDFKPYIAIIGDIVDSKEIVNRNDVQNRLAVVLNQINVDYHDDISSNFMITLGDEFQGLLSRGQDIICIIQTIEAKMYPVQIRFGIGVGDIKTDINPNIPFGADGTAYHDARDMIEEIRTNTGKQKSSQCNIKISIDQFPEIEELTNAILALCTALKEKWSKRQREIIFDYFEHGDSQVNAAKRLGITQSSIHKGFASANFYTYKNSMDIVSKMLDQIRGDTNA